MNDDIKLPPLPNVDIDGSQRPQVWFTLKDVEAYARAAVFLNREDDDLTIAYMAGAEARTPALRALTARVAELEAQLKKNDSEAKVLVRWVADLEAYMRTIATFGGTLDQARELAAKGIERAALLAKG